MSQSADAFSLVQRLKDLKEVILIIVFVISGVMWTINYFATREQLENHKCINDLTLSMLVNTKSAEYLHQIVRAARQELRTAENLLKGTAKNAATYRNISEQVEDLKHNVEKLQKSQADAETTRETALKKLQAIQLGTVKGCS
jgi:seryl-tRNA synthetase